MISSEKSSWCLAALAAVSLGILFRLYPLCVYPEIAAKNKAELIVYTHIQRSVDQFIDKKFPGMPPAKRGELRSVALRDFLSKQKTKINTMIKEAASTLRSQERTLKTPAYLMEVDPYYYLMLTERLEQKKAPPLQIKGREYFNKWTLAPNGSWYPIDYHPTTGWLVHRLLSLLVKNIPLKTAMGFVPLFLAALCVIPFLLICSRIFHLGRWPSFLGAAYLVLSPIFLRRSLWGWYDTDSYNILFPLVILYCLFLFLKEEDRIRERTHALIFAVLSCAVYSLFWRGWLLEHALISAALLLSALPSSLGRPSKERSAQRGVAILLYVLSPLVFTFAFWGWEGLSGLFKEASQLVKDFALPSFNLWPDVFLSVGELRSSNFPAMLRSLGGSLILAVAFTGILAETRTSIQESRTRICAWLTGSLLLFAACLGARIERFALLAVVPAAIGVSLGAQQVALWAKQAKRLAFLIQGILCAALLAYILWQAHLSVRFEHPIYNSSWDSMMTFLREKTPEDSIVTSWWCPGHYITSMGKRRVTFDGATQNTPQVYWVANLFLETSEDKAAAILRMLSLSGNRAVDALTDKKMSLSKAVDLIHQILPMDKEQARNTLKDTLSSEDVPGLLSMTHGVRPPPCYVFIYNDMVEQVMALEYTGRWDFSKAERFLERTQKEPASSLKRFLERSSKEHVMLMWSLAEGPYAQDNEAYEEKRDGRNVYFTNGLLLNVDTLDAELSSKKFGSGKPQNVYVMSEGILEKRPVNGANLKISVLLIKEGDGYRSVLADEKLIQSLIFRLYYLKGEGLKRFKPVASEENASNRTKITIYKVLLP